LAYQGVAHVNPALRSSGHAYGDAPWWLYAILIGVSVAILVTGMVVQAFAQVSGFSAFVRSAAASGWQSISLPGWASESRTFPLGRGKHGDLSGAVARGIGGYWCVQFLTETAGPGQTSGEVTTYHVVGLCFVGEMPRVQIAPRVDARGVYRLAGARSVPTGDEQFDKEWVLRADDAAAALDIAHHFTRVKLVDLGLRGRPIILEGTGIWTWYPEQMGDAEVDGAARLLLDVARAIPLDVYRRRQAVLLKCRTDDIAEDWWEAHDAVVVSRDYDSGAP